MTMSSAKCKPFSSGLNALYLYHIKRNIYPMLQNISGAPVLTMMRYRFRNVISGISINCCEDLIPLWDCRNIYEGFFMEITRPVDKSCIVRFLNISGNETANRYSDIKFWSVPCLFCVLFSTDCSLSICHISSFILVIIGSGYCHLEPRPNILSAREIVIKY